MNYNCNYELIKYSSKPNIDLNSFRGSMHHFDFPEKNSTVYMKNMLLRGCVLRNTDSIIGMVVYAGNKDNGFYYHNSNKIMTLSIVIK